MCVVFNLKLYQSDDPDTITDTIPRWQLFHHLWYWKQPNLVYDLHNEIGHVHEGSIDFGFNLNVQFETMRPKHSPA